MKKFNQWLNAVSILIIMIIMISVNIVWLRHEDNSDTTMRIFIIIISIVLTFILIRNIYSRPKSRKRY